MIVKTDCKFCHKPIQVEVDEFARGPFNMEKWVKFLCCDRCGRYMEAKRKLTDSIRSACVDLWAVRKQEKSKERVGKIEAATEEALIALTKRYVDMLARHSYKPITWDVQMVYALMEQPQESDKILKLYRTGVSRKPQQEMTV